MEVKLYAKQRGYGLLRWQRPDKDKPWVVRIDWYKYTGRLSYTPQVARSTRIGEGEWVIDYSEEWHIDQGTEVDAIRSALSKRHILMPVDWALTVATIVAGKEDDGT